MTVEELVLIKETEGIAEIKVINRLLRESIILGRVSRLILCFSFRNKIPFPTSMNVVLNFQLCDLILFRYSFNEFREKMVNKMWWNLERIRLLLVQEQLLRNRKKLLNYFFALLICGFPLSYSVILEKLLLSRDWLIDLNLMLLSICFEQFISLKFRIYFSDFVLFIYLFLFQFFIFFDEFLILPNPPNLVLKLLLLFWCLLNCRHDVFLPSWYFNQLITFILFNNHFSSLFFSLMLFLFILRS